MSERDRDAELRCYVLELCTVETVHLQSAPGPRRQFRHRGHDDAKLVLMGKHIFLGGTVLCDRFCCGILTDMPPFRAQSAHHIQCKIADDAAKITYRLLQIPIRHGVGEPDESFLDDIFRARTVTGNPSRVVDKLSAVGEIGLQSCIRNAQSSHWH